MSPITQLIFIIWLVLGIVFSHFYKQETRKMVIAGVIVLIILLVWFFGAPPLRLR